VVSLPPAPIDLLHWQDLPDQFYERTLRRIHRLTSEMQFDNLRHQVYIIATSLRNELQMPITDTKLGVLFGHTGGWANGRITLHLQHRTLIRANPRPTAFAVNLKAHVDKVAGTCPLYGQTEIEKE
jgi:hypothetical protein